MTKGPKWISKLAAIAIHERLLVDHGGAVGLLDEGLLDASLAAPKNQLAYGQADVFRLAATYAHAITRNHPFADGNKRVAFTLAGVFLELNGHSLQASEQDASNVILALSSRRISEHEFAEWLRVSCSLARRRAARTPSRKHGLKKRKKK